MISDTLISFLIWLYQNTLLRILPNDLPFLSFQTFTGYLDSVKSNLIEPLGVLNTFFAIDILFYMIEAMIAAELLLLAVKVVMYAINVFRGAGA